MRDNNYQNPKTSFLVTDYGLAAETGATLKISVT